MKNTLLSESKLLLPFVNTEMKKEYYPSGKLQSETLYKDGQIDGVRKLYYANGKLQSEALYKTGKMDGVVKLYYPSGKLKSEIPIKNGEVEGIRKNYYASSNICLEIAYKNGKAINGFIYTEAGKKSKMSNADFANYGLPYQVL